MQKKVMINEIATGLVMFPHSVIFYSLELGGREVRVT